MFWHGESKRGGKTEVGVGTSRCKSTEMKEIDKLFLKRSCSANWGLSVRWFLRHLVRCKGCKDRQETTFIWKEFNTFRETDLPISILYKKGLSDENRQWACNKSSQKGRPYLWLEAKNHFVVLTSKCQTDAVPSFWPHSSIFLLLLVQSHVRAFVFVCTFASLVLVVDFQMCTYFSLDVVGPSVIVSGCLSMGQHPAKRVK